MTIEKIISFLELKGFPQISAKLRELKKKEATDYHKVKRFLLKLIRCPAFILPRDHQHIKSDDVYTLPSTIINQQLEQYMNITLNYANAWVDCCMILFISDDSTTIAQHEVAFLSYSTYVEGNYEASILLESQK
jgi:hypothetical protein